MERPYWKNDQVFHHMENLTVDDIESFALSELLDNLTLLCFAHGNVDEKSVRQSVCRVFVGALVTAG